MGKGKNRAVTTPLILPKLRISERSERREHSYKEGAERRGGSDQPLDQEDGEGRRGGLPGYTPTTEDLQLKEVYGEWVHGKPDNHLHGGIGVYGAWQGWLHDLAAMPSRCYYAPSGKDG